MTTAATLFVSLRNGAILATLASLPILVGFTWNALWEEPNDIGTGTVLALLLSWLAGTAVVAAQSFFALRESKSLGWFYPCTNCRRDVAIISYRCMHCKKTFTVPPEGIAFRNSLLLGVIVFYGSFAIGAFLLRGL